MVNYPVLKYTYILVLTILAFCTEIKAQDDLLAMLGDTDKKIIEYADASFKSTRVINLHSLENTGSGSLDFKISHRFGFINGGIKELFGLDQSSIRFGFDYGLSDRLMIGLGRSSFEKTYDGLFKFKILRQRFGAKITPVTLAIFGSAAVKTIPFAEPDKVNLSSSRWYYTWQLIVGRKFTNNLSLQISPTYIRRNLIQSRLEKHDVFSFALAGRIKLSNRISLNSEYIYVLPNQLEEKYQHSLSIGFDIETGGHVFQLHFSNSTSMIEKGFITETVGQWHKGDIHFGFNIFRVFTVQHKH